MAVDAVRKAREVVVRFEGSNPDVPSHIDVQSPPATAENAL
jgi:hypothetical protein